MKMIKKVSLILEKEGKAYVDCADAEDQFMCIE